MLAKKTVKNQITLPKRIVQDFPSVEYFDNYTSWFSGDKDMSANYFGYDGPCPPWNDEIPHHYVFTLYALDSARCAVSGILKGGNVPKAIEGHVLAEASLTGTYTLNPKLG